MIDKETRERIIALVHQEVVPAIGCTEPISVALCTAKATEQLGCRPKHIDVKLSANILKNAMGVGIPGTGMITDEMVLKMMTQKLSYRVGQMALR